jgi:3-oxoacyl-[acyl-carrier-protein] synthase II
VVAEGAACTILATSDFARAHGLRQDIELAGWAMTSDAHHFVAPHLPTVARCMAGALADAGIGVRDVAAVNAHAASTRAGDLVEAEALRQVFSGRVPPVTANKSLIGHAMGASSAIGPASWISPWCSRTLSASAAATPAWCCGAGLEWMHRFPPGQGKTVSYE